MRARLVSLSNWSKITAFLSFELCVSPGVFDMSSRRSESARTRSTTRPSREDVERIMLPQAEINTAGVIIAVSTAVAEMESIRYASPLLLIRINLTQSNCSQLVLCNITSSINGELQAT